MAVSFVVNERAMYLTFRSPQGAVGRDLRRRLVAVEARAKTLCPVDRGRLRSSIRMTEPRTTPTGLEGTVGTHVRYGPAIHEGRGSEWAPPSWHTHGPPPRRFLTNALQAGRR